MIKNLASSLLLSEKMITTHQKAKATSRYVDRVIALAKKDTLPAKRMTARLLGSKKATAKLFELGLANLKTMKKNSGYSSVLKLSSRKGDRALECLVKLDSEIFKIAVPETKSIKTAKTPLKK